MPLRAYIYSHTDKPETDVKKRGDIISVHDINNPLPDNKGPSFKQFLIVQNWDDPDLEADMRANGENLRAYPYAEYEEIDNPFGTPIKTMIKRSKTYVDYNSLPSNLRRHLLDRNQVVNIISYQQVSVARKTRV